ncbi:polysaccharide export protein [Billgrantia montanilacus]|uniref:Polysaccharide export protein Wza n=1 Tax=Billgrantia montanilacus TaxID=2282305 RepID=A0A368U1N4_9GAMM|nr:polysaccharide export protein [Halomonas montanilacus]RCV91020.1 polysaccharide export protein Wza [Halomonas montanilacus]
MAIPRSLRATLASLAMLGLAGCAFAPGGHMDYPEVESVDLASMVDIEPITPALLQRIERERPTAQARSEVLRRQIAEYDYQVGPGDILSIIVYDHPELTIPAGAERSAAEAGNIIRPDGTIFYPFLGRINVAGKSTDEIRVQLTRGLSAYLTDPQVDVFVAQYNSQKAYVTGAVDEPGALPITNVPLTIVDAISAVGGPSDDAYWHDLTLIREGQEERLSLFSLLSEGDQSQNRLLRDGDQLHLASADNKGIAMLGQVLVTGNLSMNRERLSLTDALSRAGGINEERGDATGIFVMRSQPMESDKLATVYQLDVSDATAYMMASRFPLRANDVVYVTTAPLARWNRVITLILPSLGLPGDIRGGRDSFEDLL